MRREITGFSNPLIKQVRSLRDKKHRRREGLFLAEGLRILTEAREAGYLPEMLFRCADRDVHALEIVLESAVLASGGDVIDTNADILSSIANFQRICQQSTVRPPTYGW
jgi:RNA methyltransferase, TrmH family